jgi:hypothetical protein
VKAAPASILTAAIALALAGGCTVAPSPARSASSSPTPSPAASPSASSLPTSASPSAVTGTPLLLAWERQGDEAGLIVVTEGTIDRRPLPAVPNGPVAGGLHGPLAFLSGSPDKPVMWTGRGPLANLEWDALRLVPPEPQAEPFVWLCLSDGSPPRIAVQSGDNRVYAVDEGASLRSLPAGLLMLRPGGCAWTDAHNIVVGTDAPQPTFHIGYAMFDVDAGSARLVPGGGGEAPAVSDLSLAYVARDVTRQQVVWIGPIPGPGGPLLPPIIRIAPAGPAAGDLDFFHPVLSADGRRLAVIELVRPAAPRRLLVYDLFPTPTIVMQLDLHGASDAGPAWVANASAD